MNFFLLFVPLLSTLSTSTEHKVQQSEKYLKANLYQHQRNYPKALRLYNELLLDDASPYVYDGYLRLLSQMNQFPAIVSLIDKTKDFFKDDLDIQLIYAQSLLSTNRDVQAEQFLQQLQKKYPDNAHITYYLAAQSEKNNKLERAKKQITNFLDKHQEHPRKFLFLFFLAKIHFKQGNTTAALDAVNESIKLYPGFDQGILFKAFLLEKMGRLGQAIESYRAAVLEIPNNHHLKKHLVQLLLSQKRYDEAAKEFKTLPGAGTVDFLYNLALIESKGKKYNDALKTVEQALKKNKNHKQSKFLKIELLLLLNEKKLALDMMKTWLFSAPNDNIVINSLLALAAKKLSHDDIKNLLAAAAKKYPKHANIAIAQADLFLYNKLYQDALSCYQRAQKYTTDDTLRSKLNYQIGFIHVALGNRQKAEQVLEHAIAQKTVYPATFNLAAQLLEQKGGSLEKAHRYINKALETNKNCPYFLDTQGTIFYRQKKYNDAIETFQKALKNAPNDPIIQKHLKDAQQHGKK